MPITQISDLSKYEKALQEHEFVITDFYSDFCGPCKKIAPQFEVFSSQYKNIFFVKVNISKAEEITEKYAISALPTFHFYKNGDKITQVVGANLEEIKKGILKLLA